MPRAESLNCEIMQPVQRFVLTDKYIDYFKVTTSSFFMKSLIQRIETLLQAASKADESYKDRHVVHLSMNEIAAKRFENFKICCHH